MCKRWSSSGWYFHYVRYYAHTHLYIRLIERFINFFSHNAFLYFPEKKRVCQYSSLIPYLFIRISLIAAYVFVWKKRKSVYHYNLSIVIVNITSFTLTSSCTVHHGFSLDRLISPRYLTSVWNEPVSRYLFVVVPYSTDFHLIGWSVPDV